MVTAVEKRVLGDLVIEASDGDQVRDADVFFQLTEDFESDDDLVYYVNFVQSSTLLQDVEMGPSSFTSNTVTFELGVRAGSQFSVGSVDEISTLTLASGSGTDSDGDNIDSSTHEPEGLDSSTGYKEGSAETVIEPYITDNGVQTDDAFYSFEQDVSGPVIEIECIFVGRKP